MEDFKFLKYIAKNIIIRKYKRYCDYDSKNENSSDEIDKSEHERTKEKIEEIVVENLNQKSEDKNQKKDHKDHKFEA